MAVVKGQKTSMEQRLATIGRRIDSMMNSSGDVDGLRAAVRAELDVWRTWRDEVHVQAQLGTMDALDFFAPTIERVENAFAAALRRLDDATAVAGIDEDELGALVTRELGGLRRELESAGADFRIA